jgi:hypothetical protein
MACCRSWHCCAGDNLLSTHCKLQMAEAAATLEDPAAGALSLPAVLMRAQLALAGGDRGAALRLLTGLQDEATRHQPAVVATMASLQVRLLCTTSQGRAGAFDSFGLRWTAAPPPQTLLLLMPPIATSCLADFCSRC